jgi:hypothetical protein
MSPAASISTLSTRIKGGHSQSYSTLWLRHNSEPLSDSKFLKEFPTPVILDLEEHGDSEILKKPPKFDVPSNFLVENNFVENLIEFLSDDILAQDAWNFLQLLPNSPNLVSEIGSNFVQKVQSARSDLERQYFLEVALSLMARHTPQKRRMMVGDSVISLLVHLF